MTRKKLTKVQKKFIVDGLRLLHKHKTKPVHKLHEICMGIGKKPC